MVVLCILLFGTNSFAAVSPYWDSVIQVDAVVHSKAVADVLGTRITVIKSLGDLRFEVDSETCRATVTLSATGPNQAGPVSYTVASVTDRYCE